MSESRNELQLPKEPPNLFISNTVIRSIAVRNYSNALTQYAESLSKNESINENERADFLNACLRLQEAAKDTNNTQINMNALENAKNKVESKVLSQKADSQNEEVVKSSKLKSKQRKRKQRTKQSIAERGDMAQNSVLPPKREQIEKRPLTIEEAEARVKAEAEQAKAEAEQAKAEAEQAKARAAAEAEHSAKTGYMERAPKILNEIFTTEKSYRDNMAIFCMMIKEYQTAYQKDQLPSDHKMSSNNQKSIGTEFFNNLEKFMAAYNQTRDLAQKEDYSLNASLYGENRSYVQCDAAMTNINNFLKNGEISKPMFKATADYGEFSKFANKNDANKEFFSKVFQYYKANHPIPEVPLLSNVGDYMILPVQREPRYGLLIKDLGEHVKLSETNPHPMQVFNEMKAVQDNRKEVLLSMIREPGRKEFFALRDEIINKLERLSKGASESLKNEIKAAIGTAEDKDKNIKGSGLAGIKCDGSDDDALKAYKDLQMALNGIRAYQSEKGASMFVFRSQVSQAMHTIDNKIAHSKFRTDNYRIGSDTDMQKAIESDLNQKKEKYQKEKGEKIQAGSDKQKNDVKEEADVHASARTSHM